MSPTATVRPQMSPDRHVPARYVIESRLGRGGMGVVDLAVAPDGTHVALKRLALHGSADALAAARARIRREAEVLGRLDHRRIVGLLDVVDEGDDVVLVMPWMRGGSLTDRVAAGGPLGPEEVDRMADHLLGALASAHRAGVVHRDVKPANVLFDEASRPHLADFGVATARDVTAGLTGDGRVIGTPSFLAPEQARGEPATAASDVFGLGATLRWALTGVGPYGEGERAVVLHRAGRGDVDRCPSAVPAALRRRIDAMLDPRPDRRPTAAALAGGPDGTTTRPVSGAGAPRRTLRGTVAAAGRALAGPSAVRNPQPVAGGRRRRWTGALRRAAPAGSAASGSVRWRRPALIAAGAAAAVVGVVALRDGGGPVGAAAEGATTTAPCLDLPYLPCGGEAAPGTDGRRCVDGRADYDEDAANGCEAVPDDLDGTTLGEVAPTIVPADDVDEFVVEVDDHVHLTCDGRLTFDLTAPEGMALRLAVRDADGGLLGEVTSADGVPGRLRLDEPSCFGDDGTTLAAVVTPIGRERSAQPYALVRSGNW